MMSPLQEKQYNAFARLYHARETMEAAIREAMDVLWEAPSDQTEGYAAAQDLFEDDEYHRRLQTVIDALEELWDETE